MNENEWPYALTMACQHITKAYADELNTDKPSVWILFDRYTNEIKHFGRTPDGAGDFERCLDNCEDVESLYMLQVFDVFFEGDEEERLRLWGMLHPDVKLPIAWALLDNQMAGVLG